MPSCQRNWVHKQLLVDPIEFSLIGLPTVLPSPVSSSYTAIATSVGGWWTWNRTGFTEQRPWYRAFATATSLGFHRYEPSSPRGSPPEGPNYLADAYSLDTVRASSLRKGVYNPRAFLLHAALLRQACAHCGKFLTAASRRSLGRVSVPVWLIVLSNQLLIIALVGLCPTN
jgi:hypothetical protein